MQYNKFSKSKLLKSIAANYPILRELGCAISSPIVLVAEEKDFPMLLERLKNISPVRLEDCIKNENLRESANADFCWTIYCPRGSEKKMEKAVEYAMQAYVASENTTPPVLIFSDGRILQDEGLDFIFIYIKNLHTEEVSLEEVVPEDGELSLVFEKIGERVPECRTQTEKVFVAAACFLFPAYWRKGRQQEFPQIIEWARSLAEQGKASIEGVVDLFLDEAYRWQAQEKDLAVLLLPELGLEAMDHIEKTLYVDTSSLYLHEELFKKMVEPLLRIFAEDQIKAALAKEGILLPESDMTFTAKMNYRSIAGTYERRRMLRFSREKFNKEGDVEFVTACRMKRKGWSEC